MMEHAMKPEMRFIIKWKAQLITPMCYQASTTIDFLQSHLPAAEAASTSDSSATRKYAMVQSMQPIDGHRR